MRFDELLYNDDVLDALDAMHFEECTPIQEQAIPIISEGDDLIAVAQTGTGKTAAYLLPVIDRLSDGGFPEDAINCVVMAPTRELAQQIDQQMQGFSYFLPISSVPIYGGTDGHVYEQQKKGLKMGADVVIATPGRLIAHLSMGYVDLSRTSFFILDEADRMLDMGFYDDIMQIASYLPKERQTLMFSATMPPKIQQLAAGILHNPREIKLAVSKPADKIRQEATVCYETQKLPLLLRLLDSDDFKRVIIFASKKTKVRELARALKKKGLKVGEMSSDLDQTARDNVMLDFKASRINIIVATDILSRGIDIDDISLVVNYDVPMEAEDYVHRVGRTARADNDGRAMTFISEREVGTFMRIEKFLGKEVAKMEVPREYGNTPAYVSTRRRGSKSGAAEKGGAAPKQGTASKGEGRGFGNNKKKKQPKSRQPQSQQEAKSQQPKPRQSQQSKPQQEARPQQPQGNGEEAPKKKRRPSRHRRRNRGVNADGNGGGNANGSNASENPQSQQHNEQGSSAPSNNNQQ